MDQSHSGHEKRLVAEVSPLQRKDSSAKGRVYVNLGNGVQRRGKLNVLFLQLVEWVVALRGDAAATTTIRLRPVSK
jgi:hypothetical protein